jgi:hypothetical protein
MYVIQLDYDIRDLNIIFGQGQNSDCCNKRSKGESVNLHRHPKSSRNLTSPRIPSLSPRSCKAAPEFDARAATACRN